MNDPMPQPIDWTPPPVDIDRLLEWLTLGSWASAALSGAGAVYGLVMLAFGSRRAPGIIAGGAVGTILNTVIATTVLPYLNEALS